MIGGLIPTYLNWESAHSYESVDSLGRKAKPIVNVLPELVIPNILLLVKLQYLVAYNIINNKRLQ
jgi:hypothetical protein